MAKTQTIWVVDDDPELRQLLSTYLSEQGYDVRTLNDGKQLSARLEFQRPDLVVLDLMMPGEDGLTACKRLRQECGTPVLMLTALGEDDDRIEGLEGGADDYLSKPFNPRELLARIRAIMRRSEKSPPQDPFAGKRIRFAHLELDYDGRTLTAPDGTRNQVTSGELKLLSILLERPRIVMSRDELLEMTAGRVAGPLDRTIDNQISRLRSKIEPDVLRPRVISTVRNGGYSLTCDVEVSS